MKHRQFISILFISLLSNGFLIETGLAFSLVSLIGLGISGILTGGFYRYLSWILLGLMISILGILLFGYVVFSLIYLDGFHGLTALIDLFQQRYQTPMIWHEFIQTEWIGLLIAISALA